MEEITFVLTSCGRPELLKQTVESFFAHNEYPIERYIIIEDSADESMAELLTREYSDTFTILINKPKLKQIKSVDKAYGIVRPPLIFHCEDDWRFYRSGFIEESLSVLADDPRILQVWLRELWDTNHHPPEKDILKTRDGILYRKMTFDYHGWHGFSFNPGLRRKADYDVIGSYERVQCEYVHVQHEMAISQKYKDLGYYATILERGAVEHTGEERHVEQSSEVKEAIKAFLPPVLFTAYRAAKNRVKQAVRT